MVEMKVQKLVASMVYWMAEYWVDYLVLQKAVAKAGKLVDVME